MKQYIIIPTFKGEGSNYRPVWHIYNGDNFVAQYSSLESATKAYPTATVDKN